MKRTCYCGELRSQHKGQKVILWGWVHSVRDYGHFAFVTLRDREGIVQIVFDKKQIPLASDLKKEWVVEIEGDVVLREVSAINPQIDTGEIEVKGLRCEVLNRADSLPYLVDDEKVTEVLKLQYRYLYLRSQKMQKHLKIRHEATLIMRNYLSEKGFLEIETPILCKSTPEGARDYLVPSRLYEGSFYALPQSPQLLKQILMSSGYDRYFQMARCFRDEDLRSDRQPEFTQIDVELSFVNEEDVMKVTEDMVRFLWKKLKNIELPPFERMTFQEALESYGSDKPDLRLPWKFQDISEDVKGCGFAVFEKAFEEKKTIKGFAVDSEFSRRDLDLFTEQVKKAGAQGLAWIKLNEKNEFSSPFKKFVDESFLKSTFQKLGGKKGSTVFIVSDNFVTCCESLGSLRTFLGEKLEITKNIDTDKFLWISDFPAFQFDKNEKRWVAAHHPFTALQEEGMKQLDQKDCDFSSIKARAYDLVCNRYELVSGSIRIHNAETQMRILKILGFEEEKARLDFGFLMDALQHGTPPHGGFAMGLERLMMILLKTSNIRDVMAFPKTTSALDLMMKNPSPVASEQLLGLHLRTTKKSVDPYSGN